MLINFSSTIFKILNTKSPTLCVSISIGFGCLQATRASKVFRQIDSIFQAFGFGFYLLGVF